MLATMIVIVIVVVAVINITIFIIISKIMIINITINITINIAISSSSCFQIFKKNLHKPEVQDLWLAYLPRITEEAGLGDPGHAAEAGILRRVPANHIEKNRVSNDATIPISTSSLSSRVLKIWIGM